MAEVLCSLKLQLHHATASRARAGRCDGRRLLRETVWALFARTSRSRARAPSVPAEMGGFALPGHRARLDAHLSSWVAGPARRWCGVHAQAEKVPALAERSAATDQRCRQSSVVACATFLELELLRAWPAAFGYRAGAHVLRHAWGG